MPTARQHDSSEFNRLLSPTRGNSFTVLYFLQQINLLCWHADKFSHDDAIEEESEKGHFD